MDRVEIIFLCLLLTLTVFLHTGCMHYQLLADVDQHVSALHDKDDTELDSPELSHPGKFKSLNHCTGRKGSCSVFYR